MKKLALDTGYGWIKAIEEGGDQLRFPSLVGPGHDRSMADLIQGATVDEVDDLHVIYEDSFGNAGEYFVGELARLSKGTDYSFEQKKYEDTYTKVLIGTAVAMLVPEDQPIWLGAGLPFGFFNKQKDEFKNMLLNYSATVKLPSLKKERTIKFDKVSVFAQGVASIYDGLMYPNGRPRHPEYLKPGNLIAAVNWGTRTVDVAVFRFVMKDGKLNFSLHTGLSFTLDDVGGMELRRMVQAAFLKKTGSPCELLLADQIIAQGGYIFWDKEEHNFAEQIEEAKGNLVKKMLKGLVGRWGSDTNLIRATFFSGGVIQDVKSILSLDNFPTVAHVIDEPQYADARGYLHLMRLQERQEYAKQKTQVTAASPTPTEQQQPIVEQSAASTTTPLPMPQNVVNYQNFK